MTKITLLAGLGNPGSEYENTRHNAGFWLVDEIARQFSGVFHYESKFNAFICKVNIEHHTCWLLKPQTFMNKSGLAISKVCHYYKISNDQILVAHDELDFDAGVMKIKQGGGHGGHNGLRDIMAATGSRDFLRLRIGVSHPGNRQDVINYVLNKPSHDDHQKIMDAIHFFVTQLPLLFDDNRQKMIQMIHGRDA